MNALRWMPFGLSALGHLSLLALLWSLAQLPPRPPQASMEAALIFEEPGGGLPSLEPPKRQPKKPEPKPEPEPPAAKPEPKPTIRSAQPKPKPKPKPKPAPEPPKETAQRQPAPRDEPTQETPETQAGAAGSGTGGLMSAQLSAMSYKVALRQKVEQRWTAPRIERDYQILFRMTILPDGRLGDLELRESSGLDLLDQGAKKAILTASPFAPPPPELLGQKGHFEAWFRFRPEEAP